MGKQYRTMEMYDLVELWQQSGKSQRQFSAEHNIKPATFMYWVKKAGYINWMARALPGLN